MFQSFFSLSDQIFEKKIAETNNFSILNILQGSLIAFLLSSVMNLILAAIFKKNQPVF